MKFVALALTVASFGLAQAALGDRSPHLAPGGIASRHAAMAASQQGKDVEAKNHKRSGQSCKAKSSTAAAAPSSTSVAISSKSTSAAISSTFVTVRTSAAPSSSIKATKVSSTATSVATDTSDSTVTIPGPSSGHQFTLTNKCSNSVLPVIANTACGYSPRCAGASDYSGSPLVELAPGATEIATINDDWVGRIFVQDGSCGPSGEDCTILEFNLDTGSFYTPQAYDISNIQGFTQSISLGAQGCDTVTCTNANCGCSNAYPIGDETGCGDDAPVKACGAGNIAFTVVFCP